MSMGLVKSSSKNLIKPQKNTGKVKTVVKNKIPPLTPAEQRALNILKQKILNQQRKDRNDQLLQNGLQKMNMVIQPQQPGTRPPLLADQNDQGDKKKSAEKHILKLVPDSPRDSSQ